MQIDAVLERMTRAASLDQLSSILQGSIEEAGFAAFEHVDVTRPDAAESLGGTLPAWREIYTANRFDRVDPYLFKARHAELPFEWRSIPAPGAINRSIARLMKAAYDFGLREGFVCPHHLRDAAGLRRHHVCALFWTGDLATFRERVRRDRSKLHLLATCYMQRAVRLREDGQVHTPEWPGKLTSREIDLLSWAARGKTSAESATILNISPLTAETHMRNAILKLDAKNRTHAVALALARGLIAV